MTAIETALKSAKLSAAMIVEKLDIDTWIERKGFRAAYLAGVAYERSGSAVDAAKSEAAALATLEANEAAALEAIAARVTARENAPAAIVTESMRNA